MRSVEDLLKFISVSREFSASIFRIEELANQLLARSLESDPGEQIRAWRRGLALKWAILSKLERVGGIGVLGH
jgi:hypothetical protein